MANEWLLSCGHTVPMLEHDRLEDPPRRPRMCRPARSCGTSKGRQPKRTDGGTGPGGEPNAAALPTTRPEENVEPTEAADKMTKTATSAKGVSPLPASGTKDGTE